MTSPKRPASRPSRARLARAQRPVAPRKDAQGYDATCTDGAGASWRTPTRATGRLAPAVLRAQLDGLAAASEHTLTRATVTLSLPYPDHRLSLNGREHWRTIHRLRQEQHGAAALVAASVVPAQARPWFAADVPLFVTLTMARPARGKRWDCAACIEATKAALDAFNGIVYRDDAQIVGFRVEWTRDPAGAGLVRVRVTAEEAR